MSTIEQRVQTTRDGGSGWVTAATAIFLIVAATRLTMIDLARWREAQSLEGRNTKISSYGSLTGQTTAGAAWSRIGTKRHYVVLFSLPEGNLTETSALWQQVAELSRRSKPDLEFVGVCENSGGCRHAAGPESFVSLSFMDPHQMHALSLARQQRQALLYRDQLLIATIPIAGEITALAQSLVQKAN